MVPTGGEDGQFDRLIVILADPSAWRAGRFRDGQARLGGAGRFL
jgi:hypothetical protein